MRFIKNYKITLLIVCCIVSLFFVFYSLNKMQEMRHIQSSLSDLQIKEDFYSNNFKIGCLMSGAYAPDISYLEEVHEIKISELAKDRPVLICLYKTECSACDKVELKELHYIFKDIPETVYILCPHFIKRDVYVYTKKNNINISVFGISSDLFNWIAEEYNKLYYFVLHPDLRISHFYFPDKQYPEINKQYLELVKSYLSKYK